MYCFSAAASCSCRIWLTVTEDVTWALTNSAARPLGPLRNRSSALELLPTLHPEARATDATELCAVCPAEPPGVVVVVAGAVVVLAEGDVVGAPVAGGVVVDAKVAGGEVVDAAVAGGDVVGAPVAGGVVVDAKVAGGEVVVPACASVVDGVAAVVDGLGGEVVVVTLPPGAALGTVVGVGLWEINLGTTSPATTASTRTPPTAAPMPTALSRPRGRPGGVGAGGDG